VVLIRRRPIDVSQILALFSYSKFSLIFEIHIVSANAIH